MTARNPIGALPLALSAAAVYVVLAGAAGYLALDRQPAAPPPAAAAPDLPAITTDTPASTTAAAATTPPAAAGTTASTTQSPPPDLRRIDAPGGLSTVVPVGWEVTTGTVATTLVVTDPTSPRRELRLGGAPVTDPSTTLLDRITRAAADREREPGHRRVTLVPTTIRDHPAVSWEFDENTPAGPNRVATAFWEAGGVEYVLYSAGPAEEWDRTRSRLAGMVERAAP
ncbi:hypothetical protein [Saccharothrix texasensis]|uniref:Alanine and proline-rich secreted protein Apa n=1 Tax=Saccharothrix texasensis TaxID=103734 RepID=A0A3N1HD76_9PSEU|nr:hypothetical protein [Saccharothrix texasensis]ROP40448.1 hypothetical protein EDD40_5860 [Saccharothrix texasensis]